MKPRTIALIFGTRPEAIKLYPVLIELLRYPKEFKPILISTGQHDELLQQALEIFPNAPEYDLKVMSADQSLAKLSARLITALDKVLHKVRPDLVLVQGDTTTTFLAALTAFYLRIPVGHIEAGLRTYERYAPFPEELNRMLTTNLATLHFAPTRIAYQAVLKQAPTGAQIFCTGNTVIDTLSLILKEHKTPWSKRQRPYVLITAHRRESFGLPFQQICQAIADLAKKFSTIDFVYPVHLNPNVQKVAKRYLRGSDNILLLPPQRYIAFTQLMANALLIMTDSGGVQEEAPAIGVPVLVLREKSERPEALAAQAASLVGTDRSCIVREASLLLTNAKKYRKMSQAISPYGDGRASERIVQALRFYYGTSKKRPTPYKPNRGKILLGKRELKWPK